MNAQPHCEAPPQYEECIDQIEDRRRVIAGSEKKRNTNGVDAIQMSQNSVQPRAMPYVARMEPVKIQASAHAPYEPRRSKIQAKAIVPLAMTAIMATRSRVVAQWGGRTARPESRAPRRH